MFERLLYVLEGSIKPIFRAVSLQKKLTRVQTLVYMYKQLDQDIPPEVLLEILD